MSASFSSLIRARAHHPDVLSQFLKEYPEDSLFPWFSPSAQSLFASAFEVLYSSQFPPSESYALRLLQRYAILVESRIGMSVSDDMFATVLSSFSARSLVVNRRRGINAGDQAFVDKDELCYVSFEDERLGGVLGFRIAPYANDVGLRIWEGEW